MGDFSFSAGFLGRSRSYFYYKCRSIKVKETADFPVIIEKINGEVLSRARSVNVGHITICC